MKSALPVAGFVGLEQFEESLLDAFMLRLHHIPQLADKLIQNFKAGIHCLCLLKQTP